MTQSDIIFALKMTGNEDWGYLKEDFERLIYFDPEGCFVAHQEEQPVGIVTTSLYGDYGFLGTLIVDAACRGKGIGEALMNHSMAYLHRRGATTLELDGVFPAVPLYRRLGFRDKYLSYRFRRTVNGSSGNPLLFEASMLEELIEFDRKMTGLDRRKYLTCFAEEFPASIYVSRDRAMRAYALVRPRPDNRFAIGPMVAASAGSAEKLLLELIGQYPGKTIGLGVPEPNLTFIELLRNLKFEYLNPSLRMYRGEFCKYEQHMYAIMAPEKG